MNGSPSTMNIPDIRLPMQFIVTGLLLFVAAQGMVLVSVEPLAMGNAQVPTVLAAAHLLILGFGVMVASGAMYQLVPVALQTSIYSTRLGHWQFVIYTVGTLGLWWSFYDFSPVRLVCFASLTVLGILLFEYNLWMSIRGVKRTAISVAVKCALVYLLLTVVIGLWMAVDFSTPHLGIWHTRLLYVHILFGMVGWFTLLIIGISYKLVAMFALSHGYESRLEMDAVRYLNYSVIIVAVGFLTNWAWLTWIGAVGIGLGFMLFGLQLKRILRHRMKKKLDLGLRVALFAWPYTAVLIVALAVFGLITGGKIAVLPLIYLVLTGWISLTILGYLQKIVPFLWWTHRYSRIIGAADVPLLKDMIREKFSQAIFAIMIIAITAVFFSLGTGVVSFLWVSQAVLFIASGFYALTILRVLSK